MSDDSPPDERLTYDEVDQVLRRATELQHGDPKGEGSFGLAEVERLGEEIGLSSEAVQAALVHVRSGALVPTEPRRKTLLDRFLGLGEVVVRRRVKGPVSEVWERINAFMGEQLFGVRRNYGNRVLWGPNQGLVSQFRRALDVADRYTVRGADEVEAAVLELPNGEIEVVFTARFPNSRRHQMWGNVVGFGVLAGVGALVALPLATVSTIAAAISIAGGAGMGGVSIAVSRRTYRRRIEAVEMALARQLDALEHER